jgi:hypothetical protein
MSNSPTNMILLDQEHFRQVRQKVNSNSEISQPLKLLANLVTTIYTASWPLWLDMLCLPQPCSISKQSFMSFSGQNWRMVGPCPGGIRLPPLAALTELESPEMWFPLALLRKVNVLGVKLFDVDENLITLSGRRFCVA